VPSTECPAALGRALLYRAELGVDVGGALAICEDWRGVDGLAQPAQATRCKEGVVAQYALQTLGEGLRGLLPAPADGALGTVACVCKRESGPGGLTREVETPLPSNSPDATRWRHPT
jgi:hypothetical protein